MGFFFGGLANRFWGRRAVWLVGRRSEEVFVLCYFDDGFSIELENVLYVELISNIGSI